MSLPDNLDKFDKFARVAALRPARARQATPERATAVPSDGDSLSRLLGAQGRRNHFGEHLSLERWYATPEVCPVDSRALSLLLPKDFCSETLLASATDPENWLFLDTETTGISGGTGTYPFLVGIAWWADGGLQVEQLFMRDLNEEHSLLLELAERMTARPVLVTFNGKSFDWPLIETRYRMARSIRFSVPAVHLDFLHPARQLWRPQIGSVRLKDLERCILGECGQLDWSREDDIDSTLIPQMYFDYLRGGPAEPLAGIFHHNRMDLRGLAALATRILDLLNSRCGIADAPEANSYHPIEIFGLSRILQRRGHSTRAREFYENALNLGLPGPLERVAQRELAQLSKRERDYARAISLWETLRSAPTLATRKKQWIHEEDTAKAFESALEAAEQLAIFYEHRAKDRERAIELIRDAMAGLLDTQRRSAVGSSRARKLEFRLARRLERLESRRTSLPIPPLLSLSSNR